MTVTLNWIPAEQEIRSLTGISTQLAAHAQRVALNLAHVVDAEVDLLEVRLLEECVGCDFDNVVVVEEEGLYAGRQAGGGQ